MNAVVLWSAVAWGECYQYGSGWGGIFLGGGGIYLFKIQNCRNVIFKRIIHKPVSLFITIIH